MESLNQCRRLEVPEKARNVFCDEPTSVWLIDWEQYFNYGRDSTIARAIWNFQEGNFGTHNIRHDMPAICEQYDAKTQCKDKKTLVQ